MRTANKNIHGEVPKRNQLYRTTRPPDGQAAEEHRRRLEALATRIQQDEELLKSRKIKPYDGYSAGKFDELREVDKAVEKVIEEYGPTLKLLKET